MVVTAGRGFRCGPMPKAKAKNAGKKAAAAKSTGLALNIEHRAGSRAHLRGINYRRLSVQSLHAILRARKSTGLDLLKSEKDELVDECRALPRPPVNERETLGKFVSELRRRAAKHST